MKLIKPSYEILEQSPGLKGIYKAIEVAGRTCYKSLDKITEDSAEGFVDRMIKSQHYAMLEHGTVYLKVPVYDANCIDFPHGALDGVTHSPYSKVNHEPTPELENLIDWTGGTISTECMYITTNYRVLVENDALCLLEYLCEPTELHEKRVTVRFTTDRGVSHEFVRHRVFSFAQESTRYCNYSKDKFGHEITFIEPTWFDKESCDINYIKYPAILTDGFFPEYDYSDWNGSTRKEITKEAMFIWSLLTAERAYFEAIRLGAKPQEARQILPNALKTELVMTGFVSDWQHFFDLRARGTTGAPHPDAKALAEPLMHEFENRNLI